MNPATRSGPVGNRMHVVSVGRLAAAVVVAAGLFGGRAAAAEPDLRLIEALKRQDEAQVRALLLQRLDVGAALPDGTTALHWAVHRDDRRAVAALLRAGAKVNATTDAGVTPLWLACQGNAAAETVQRLLTAGANPDLVPESGDTALMWCARAGNLDGVKALLARGASVDRGEPRSGQTALMWAAAAGHADVVQTLVELGASVGARTAASTALVYNGYRYVTAPPANPDGIIVNTKQGGFTPLLFAAQQGDTATATVLMAAGADVNDTDASGASALVVAAHSGHRAAAALLVARGADVNAAGAGYAPLHAAVLRGDLALVQTLLARGASPNARLTAGTPVRKYGVDYALSSAWLGATPYWLAAKFAEHDIMKALAAAGADTRLPLTDGTTPLMAALQAGQGQGDRRDRFQTDAQIAAATLVEATLTPATALLALDLGADVNAANRVGDTALHVAAARGQAAVVPLLAARGAAIDAKNRRGQTALTIAIARRRPPVIDTFGTGAAAPATPASSPVEDALRAAGAKE